MCCFAIAAIAGLTFFASVTTLSGGHPVLPIMLTVNGLPKRTCAGPSRRDLLQIGGAGLFGLSLPKVFAAESLATGDEPFAGGKAKSVIFLFLFGGRVSSRPLI